LYKNLTERSTNSSTRNPVVVGFTSLPALPAGQAGQAGHGLADENIN